jgi:hypothetical protein
VRPRGHDAREPPLRILRALRCMINPIQSTASNTSRV